MIKGRISNFKDIDFLEEKVSVIEIHNKKLYRSIWESLKNYRNKISGPERIVFVREEKEIDLSGKIILCDVGNIGTDSRIIQKKLIDRVTGSIKEDFELISHIEQSYIDILDKIGTKILEMDLDIQYETELAIEKILKLIGLEINIASLNILDQLYRFIDIISEFEICEILILNNAKLFFEHEEFEEIYTYLVYKKVKTLLIEGIEDAILSEKEHKLIIDTDFDDYFAVPSIGH